MRFRKSQGDLITTVFLVGVLIAATLFLINYQSSMFAMKFSVNSRLMGYDLSEHVKRQIFACYGNPIMFDPIIACSIPVGHGDASVDGYEIVQMDYGFCSEKTIINHVPDEYEDKIVYIVPIKDNEINCMGRLIVYI